MKKIKSYTLFMSIVVVILIFPGCDGDGPTNSDPNAPKFELAISPENGEIDQLLNRWSGFVGQFSG